MANVPRYLQPTKFVLGERPELPVDALDGEGSAKDTVRGKPSQKTKTVKKVKKSLALMEEWVDFVTKKRQSFIEDL